MTIKQAAAILKAERVRRSVGIFCGFAWTDYVDEAFGVVDADPVYTTEFDDLREGSDES
jgi:hypothetical protein